jgi:Leucine-rich repeat (LRR) protein
MSNFRHKKNNAFFESTGGREGVVAGSREGRNTSLQSASRHARQTGVLSVSNMGLTEVDDSLFDMETLQEDEKFWEINPCVKVDLSFNSLATLPDGICKLKDIQTLQLRKNKLEMLPTQIWTSCTLIHSVDVSSNSLGEIEDSISELQSLSDADFSKNRLVKVTNGIGRCQQLQRLFLQGNLLRQVPDSLSELSNLVELNLSNNCLESLPNLFRMKMLNALYIRGNRLKCIPDLTQLSALQVLDAGENLLTNAPSLPCPPSAIKAINLSHNKIAGLDLTFVGRANDTLSELHINDNLIGELPEEFALLQRLKVLNIANNELADLPPSIGYMLSLEKMHLDGNRIKSIRRSLLSQTTEDLKKYLRSRGADIAEKNGIKRAAKSSINDVISVFDSRLRDITGGLLDLQNASVSSLESLDEAMQRLNLDPSGILSLVLSNNQFSAIPEELFLFNSIKKLDFSMNMLGSVLQQLPIEVCSTIHQLEHLDISSNKLSAESFDWAITALCLNSAATVSVVLAPNNKITTVPPSICHLGVIRELNLSDNNLTSVEALDPKRLVCLEVLNLSNNKIRSISNLCYFTNLIDLLLENNDITDVPDEIGRLPKLRRISLHGNPQKKIRFTVLQNGSDAVLRYLKGRLGPVETGFEKTNSNNDQRLANVNGAGGPFMDQNSTGVAIRPGHLEDKLHELQNQLQGISIRDPCR